jgi:hypothetical protein
VGLQKIPKKGAVENNASYFYNLVDFRDLWCIILLFLN